MTERHLILSERLRRCEQALKDGETFSNKDLFELVKELKEIHAESGKPVSFLMTPKGHIAIGSYVPQSQRGQEEKITLDVREGNCIVEDMEIVHDTGGDSYSTRWRVQPVHSGLADSFVLLGTVEVELSGEQSRNFARSLLEAHKHAQLTPVTQ